MENQLQILIKFTDLLLIREQKQLLIEFSA